MRPSQRAANQLRNITIQRDFTKHAEGSVLISVGDTRVLCTASIVPNVPRFLKGTGQGWLTAEYGMLPRSTHERIEREAVRGKQSGRTLEIQRLIGRALRTAVNLKNLGEHTIAIDCDVLQADGGTRTAAITGGCVALADALRVFARQNKVEKPLFLGLIASVSVGIYQGEPVLDLDYQEDSKAETDMNVVMNHAQEFIEIQGTAEKRAFKQNELTQLLELASAGISSILTLQQQTLEI